MAEQQPRDRHVRRSGDDYAQALMDLLPRGQAWPRHPFSTLVQTIAGLADYWGFVDSRAADLLERESDPRETLELLPDWERNWGLPDPCFTTPQTIEDRHWQLVTKMTLLGRQDRAWFIGVAAALGYTITITEYAPWMFGVSQVGRTDDGTGYWRWEIGPPEMRFFWTVHISGAHLSWWRFGSAIFGVDPHLRIGSAHDLECLFNRWKPAHTKVIFDYSDSGGAVDTTVPVISAVASSGLTLSSATITWTTDEPATSQVEYGPTTAYGSLTTLDTTLVDAHSVALSGLSPGTTYHYRVRSQDVVPNEAIGTDNTLTTVALTWARMQGVVTTAGGSTSMTLTLPANVITGNIVVGAVLTFSPSQVTGITDDKGNQYQIVNQDGLGKNYLIVTGFRSVAPITNNAKTLTITYGSSGVGWGIAEEFSVGTPLSAIAIDGTQVLIDSTGLAMPAFQTLRNGDLLWSASFDTGNISKSASFNTGLGDGTQQMSMWKQLGAPSSAVVADFASNAGNTWSTAFGISPAARTSWQQRQNQIQRTNAGGTSGSVTFVNPVANGSLVVGTVAMNNAGGTGPGDISDITSISDDKGNTYSMISASITGRVMFWARVTNAPQTITVTTSIAEGLIYFLANEFVPPPGTTSIAIDGTPTMTSPPSSPFHSGTITTTHDGDLIYSEADMTGGNASPANGFSVLNGMGMTWADGYLIQGSAGPVEAIWTGGSGGSISMGLVAFRAS